MWLSVGYHLQISNIGPAQQTIDQKLTLRLFDQLCVNQIYFTTFEISVAPFDGSTYRKTFQCISVSKDIDTKLIKIS